MGDRVGEGLGGGGVEGGFFCWWARNVVKMLYVRLKGTDSFYN
jgi:hypothetical protein